MAMVQLRNREGAGAMQWMHGSVGWHPLLQRAVHPVPKRARDEESQRQRANETENDVLLPMGPTLF